MIRWSVALKRYKPEATRGFCRSDRDSGGQIPGLPGGPHSPPGGRRILGKAIARTFLKDLSCDVLPISMKSKNKLRDFGLRTLGQMVALAPGPLLSQFGPEGKRIRELARGYDATPLIPALRRKNRREYRVVFRDSLSRSSI